MKHYYISAELGEGIPDYDFVIKANDLQDAENKALDILCADYPDEFPWENAQDRNNYTIHEVTPEQLLERMTIN